MSEKNKNAIAMFRFFSDISGSIGDFSQFSKRHTVKHQNGQLCDNLTDLVSLTVIETPHTTTRI